MSKQQEGKITKKLKIKNLKEDECIKLLKGFKKMGLYETKAYVFSLLALLKQQEYSRRLEFFGHTRDLAGIFADELAYFTKKYTNTKIKPENFLDQSFRRDYAKLLLASGIPDIEEYFKRWCEVGDYQLIDEFKKARVKPKCARYSKLLF